MASKNLKVLAGMISVLAISGCNESNNYEEITECSVGNYKWACMDTQNLKKCVDNKVVLEACAYGCDDARCKSQHEGEPCTTASFSETCIDASTLEICSNDRVTTKACTYGCDGNKCKDGSVDPGNNQDHHAPAVQACGTLSVSGTNKCEMTGSGSKIVLRGDVLALDKTYTGGSVVIEGNKITYVGCEPDLNNATVITCPNSVISPGLINGHDHITYSNAKPDNWGDERFDHRMDWRKGVYGHSNHNGDGTKNNEVGELRMLMSGVTSLYGSGKVDGLVRNIDKEDIGNVKASTYQTFPLGDSKEKTYRTQCSQYKYNGVKSESDMEKTANYGPHIGEGINDSALLELKCLSGEGNGSIDIFKDNLAIIHGVAATPAVMALMAQRGSKLIWSPRTNISLYGDTANVVAYDNLGVTIALGSDWIYSGSANMLREFACVNSLNQIYYNNHFTDFDIWKMATVNGAEALGFGSVIGQLKAGYMADIAIYEKDAGRSAHAAVTKAENKNVQLVMIDGVIAYGDTNIVPEDQNCETVDVCNVSKRVCPNGIITTYSSIKANAKYDLFFCGEPSDEPTCIPQRTRAQDTTDQGTTQYDGNKSDNFSDPNDTDGDGIPNAQDNCPNIFNPARPQDKGNQSVAAQGDADSDGIGDACDEYPLCADNNSSCPVYNGNDTDKDGIDNNVDNCPSVANPDQTDTDSDGIGDACDECKDDKNLADGRCPVKTLSTIPQVNALIAETCTDLNTNCAAGETQYLVSGRVTAIHKSGFFIQTPDDTSANNGIYIYTNSKPEIELNDDVKVQGTLASYYGLRQITNPFIDKVSSDNPAIAPTQISGTNLIDYSGMLVKFDNISVSAKVQGKKSTGETVNNDFVWKFTTIGANDLHLASYLWTIDPEPAIGSTYTSATGVILLTNSLYRLAPRDANDLVGGSGGNNQQEGDTFSIAASAESAAYGSEVTLTITLDEAATADTTFLIECGDGTCPDSAVIAAGQTSVSVQVTMASSGNTSVSVSYDGETNSLVITGTAPQNPPSNDFSVNHEMTFANAKTAAGVDVNFSDYNAVAVFNLDGGIVVTAAGAFKSSGKTGTTGLEESDLVSSIVLNSKSEYTYYIEVTGLNGVGNVTFEYAGWEAGTLDITSNGSTQTQNFDSVPEQGGSANYLTYTYNFNDSAATSFKIYPQRSSNLKDKPRVVIRSLSWTSKN